MDQKIMSEDTIVAVATPSGTGGIAVIRVSGESAISVVEGAWKGKSLEKCASHTAHLGKYKDITGNLLDEVIITVYRGPNSFTGENVIEIACHGSRWIQRQIVNDLINRGARGASPGEFSQRAFLNGRIDLAQAEGIADLIAASSRAAHQMALQQMSGVFSSRLDSLRLQLTDLASLLELELDFSEEDVEFADRGKLIALCDEIILTITRLADSYNSGRALKEGIPVVIAGAPNAGKSTLLNFILGEDKAIVSDIPGTTRDIIEDTIEINGVLFRFVDTAGLRVTEDRVERIGIERAEERLTRAAITLWIVDATLPLGPQVNMIRERLGKPMQSGRNLLMLNKCDLLTSAKPEVMENEYAGVEGDAVHSEDKNKERSGFDNFKKKKHESSVADKIKEIRKMFGEDQSLPIILPISAKSGEGMDQLLLELEREAATIYTTESDVMVTNARHYTALMRGLESLKAARTAITENLSADFVAQDVREALHHLATVTGAISTPDLLSTIFSRFCIGK